METNETLTQFFEQYNQGNIQLRLLGILIIRSGILKEPPYNYLIEAINQEYKEKIKRWGRVNQIDVSSLLKESKDIDVERIIQRYINKEES